MLLSLSHPCLHSPLHPSTPPLLRRRLEVLVRGVLVAVHLHARHVLLLRTRCLVHLDEALVVRVSAVPPSDDDDAHDHSCHHGDAGERQGHVDRVVVAHLHSSDRVARLAVREIVRLSVGHDGVELLVVVRRRRVHLDLERVLRLLLGHLRRVM